LLKVMLNTINLNQKGQMSICFYFCENESNNYVFPVALLLPGGYFDENIFRYLSLLLLAFI
jgi:hypothetical protein